MFKDFIGKNVTVIIATRTDNLLEYSGILEYENDVCITLRNVNIGYMMLNFQKGIFGSNIGQYTKGVEKVNINKSYIISCNSKEE